MDGCVKKRTVPGRHDSEKPFRFCDAALKNLLAGKNGFGLLVNVQKGTAGFHVLGAIADFFPRGPKAPSLP